MCLKELVSFRTKNPKFKLSKDEKGYYGWKVYNWIQDGYACPSWYGEDQEIGVWIHSDDCFNSRGNIRIELTKKQYKPGFHVYVNKPKETFVRKVYIKQIVAKGFQVTKNRVPVIVCKKIFIISRRDSR